MRFVRTNVEGAWIVEPHRIEDERGFFARAWCRDELEAAGLCGTLKQSNMASSHRTGTLRGLHFQRSPHEEVKFVRCVKGAVFDVVVDLRPDSSTYLKWDGVELNDTNHLALYVPAGCATGYITLVDNASIHYHTSQTFNAASASGVRFDDPAFGIDWPIEPIVLSAQDRAWPYIVRSDRSQ